MTDLDLNHLREIAEYATPGPWENVSSERTMNDRSEWRIGDSHKPKVLSAVMRAADAEHIAAFDPPTVLAMINEIERLHNASEFEQRARLQFAALGVPVDEQDEWFRRIAVPAAAGLTLNEFMQLVRAFLSGVSLVDVGGESE